MTRRQFQTCDSVFTIETRPLGYFVSEVWWQTGRNGEQEDEFELYGPFPTREAAVAEKVRLEGL